MRPLVVARPECTTTVIIISIQHTAVRKKAVLKRCCLTCTPQLERGPLLPQLQRVDRAGWRGVTYSSPGLLVVDVLGILGHGAETQAPTSHHVMCVAIWLHQCMIAMHRDLLVVTVCHVSRTGRDDSLTGREWYCDMDMGAS